MLGVAEEVGGRGTCMAAAAPQNFSWPKAGGHKAAVVPAACCSSGSPDCAQHHRIVTYARGVGVGVGKRDHVSN